MTRERIGPSSPDIAERRRVPALFLYRLADGLAPEPHDLKWGPMVLQCFYPVVLHQVVPYLENSIGHAIFSSMNFLQRIKDYVVEARPGVEPQGRPGKA